MAGSLIPHDYFNPAEIPAYHKSIWWIPMTRASVPTKDFPELDGLAQKSGGCRPFVGVEKAMRPTCSVVHLGCCNDPLQK